MQCNLWGRICHVFCAAALFGVLSPLHANQRPITFSGVTGKQRLVIDYQTVAESDKPSYTVTFRPTPKPQLSVKYAEASPSMDGSRREIGSFSPSPSQLVLLDNLLRYYRRHDKEGGCTTQHYVTLSLMKGNTVLRKESYVDETCNIEVVANATPKQRKELKLTDPPLLTFDEIIDAIRRHGQVRRPG